MGAYFPTLMSAIHVRAVFTHNFVHQNMRREKYMNKSFAEVSKNVGKYKSEK